MEDLEPDQRLHQLAEESLQLQLSAHSHDANAFTPFFHHRVVLDVHIRFVEIAGAKTSLRMAERAFQHTGPLDT